MTEQDARDELTELVITSDTDGDLAPKPFGVAEPLVLNMFIKERKGWRQFAVMREAGARHSLVAARKEGSRVVAATPDGRVWGASQEKDRQKF